MNEEFSIKFVQDGLFQCYIIEYIVRICEHIQSNFTMFNNLHHHVGSRRVPRKGECIALQMGAHNGHGID